MSIESIIKTALSPLSIPVKPDGYIGEATEYTTYNYDTSGGGYGDDKPMHEVYSVQVHYFCPLSFNSVAKRTQLKQLLFAADFSWPDMTDATDEDGQHWVFECEALMGVDVDG